VVLWPGVAFPRAAAGAAVARHVAGRAAGAAGPDGDASAPPPGERALFESSWRTQAARRRRGV
jgi:hypothetical protein